jgi:hypothetical protein
MAACFLIGLHMPAIHRMAHHGARVPVSVFAAMALPALVGVTGLWHLLRVTRHSGPHRLDPAAGPDYSHVLSGSIEAGSALLVRRPSTRPLRLFG